MNPLKELTIDFGMFQSALYHADWWALTRLFIELCIILYAIVWLWGRIRGTQAERLVKGLMMLVVICLASWVLGFTLITSILQSLIPVALLGILIIFQPEIRRGLGYLGRGKAFRMDLSLRDSAKHRSRMVVQEIIAAVRELSRIKCGALIVVEEPDAEWDYLTPGTPVNADVSHDLLLSIFYPASPLHDGAAILRKDKIVAAGVILPITDNPKLSYRYGTRHRAALGLSEIYDGLCIIVSEETGAISLASRGMLMRLTDADELNDPLSYMYEHESTDRPSNPLQLFLSVFGRPRRGPIGFKGQIDRVIEEKPEAQSSEEAEGEPV